MAKKEEQCVLCGAPISDKEIYTRDELGPYHYGCAMEQGDLDELDSSSN